jgi:hypothetical protein
MERLPPILITAAALVSRLSDMELCGVKAAVDAHIFVLLLNTSQYFVINKVDSMTP